MEYEVQSLEKNLPTTRNQPVALITGVTGQDGAYLAEFLLKKGYVVHGIKRRCSSSNTARIDHLPENAQVPSSNFFLHHGDMTDSSSITRIVAEVQPNEIYNLAAQSHVAVSFEEPEYTANSDALGPLRILEAIRILGMEKMVRFYQASTSELYGAAHESPQSETTPFQPRSPYAIAKLYAYWITVNYREAYGMFACNGILFNHESPLRGETFVTQKICRALTRISIGEEDCLYLGNLDAKRDWGHARDYVQMQWLMLQQEKPDDYVIATGTQYSVRDFVIAAAAEIGITVSWRGSGLSEVGYVSAESPILRRSDNFHVGQEIVRVDSRHFRPTEVDSLLGDATKAYNVMGWKPTSTFAQLVGEMMQAELSTIKRDLHARQHDLNMHEFSE